jgi:hypothetical protein
MGSMTRRMMRSARRRLGELTDQTYDNLELIAELADALDEDDVVAWCENAISSLEDTLNIDGLPTDDTESLLPELVQGIGDALRLLRPAADADPSAYPLQT